jgi:hypothetical protein
MSLTFPNTGGICIICGADPGSAADAPSAPSALHEADTADEKRDVGVPGGPGVRPTLFPQDSQH